MLVFDVLYYYYYRLYSLSKLDNDPSFTARLALTASESFLITAVLSILYAYFFCKKFKGVELAIIVVLMLVINLFAFLPSKRAKKVLESKPKLFNSDPFSLIFTIFFFVFTTSILFWLNDVVDYVITNCR